jgi:hypothetical protein
MWSVPSADLIARETAHMASFLKTLLFGAAAGGLLAILPMQIAPWNESEAQAQEESATPPSDEFQPDPGDDAGAPPADDASGEPPADNADVEPLNPGEAVVTRFSHVVDSDGNATKVIDVNGVSASIVDLRNPGEPPYGQHWINEPQRLFVTAGEVGQVFGVTLAKQEGETGPTIFLAATAAYGLHRTGSGKNSDWMAGQWGPYAGPGTIYRISAETGYRAEKFADVTLNGRENTGAALGNIAYDKAHGRLFVSDLETGMIHALDAETGKDMGRYDHGAAGRTDFLDVWSGQQMALGPVIFDPATSARIDDCTGAFGKTPECWNIADFRRRVWGLKVRSDEAGAVRLYYSVWGSDAFGNPDWAKAGDDRRNAVWSVAITDDGLFDTSAVRREFFMPAFWPSAPALGDKAGNSNAVSDITFPECTAQNVMLVSERGGMRNLGLDREEPFSRPYQSRVVRYELGEDNIWRPKGRYDVGFHDRSIKDGEPVLFASSAGGTDFNYRIGEDGNLDFSAPSQSVWMTGDGLCSPLGGCTDKARGAGGDTSEVHGVQGMRADAFVLVEPGPKLRTDALLGSYMIDTDIDVDQNVIPVAVEMTRNDATKIGDIATYQVCEAAAPLPAIDVPAEEPVDEYMPPAEEPPILVPVHTRNMSHQKWASNGHRVNLSWHWRRGSWHYSERSWHWREGSWHRASRSWHWREGSWHNSDRSWHRRQGSWHDRAKSWHFKIRSYHMKNRTWGDHDRDRSFHVKGRSWDDHVKRKSFHFKGRTWGDHFKARSFHLKGRTWDDHVKGRSSHLKGRTWRDDVRPNHVKRLSFHIKGRTWDNVGKPGHIRRLSLHAKNKSGDKGKQHFKGRTWSDDVIKSHSKRKSLAEQKPKPKHLRSRSRADDAVQTHSKRRSVASEIKKPRHLRSRSRGDDVIQNHQRRRSIGVQDTRPTHLKSRSRGDNNLQPQHLRSRSRGVQDIQPRHQRRQSMGVHNDDQQQLHGRRRSMVQQ